MARQAYASIQAHTIPMPAVVPMTMKYIGRWAGFLDQPMTLVRPRMGPSLLACRSALTTLLKCRTGNYIQLCLFFRKKKAPTVVTKASLFCRIGSATAMAGMAIFFT